MGKGGREGAKGPFMREKRVGNNIITPFVERVVTAALYTGNTYK